MDLSSFPLEYEPRRRLPLAFPAVLCALLLYLWVLGSGLYGLSPRGGPLVVLGALCAALTLLDLRIGLGLLIFAVGISPEFKLGGISNLRLEDFLFPVLFLGWLFQALARNERFAPTNLKVPIMLTVLLSLVSSLQNSVYSQLDLLSGTLRMVKSLEYFLIFAVTLNVLRRKEDLRVFAYLMPVAASFVGIYGIWQSFLSDGRVTGPLGETSNVLGGYLVLHLCLAIGLLSSGTPHRPALLFAVAILLVPLLQTMSRTSCIALFAGLVAMFAARRNRWTAAVLVASLLLVFASTVISDRYHTIFDVFHGDAPQSLVMRLKGWMVFLEYLPQKPLLGQGIGNKTLGAFDNEYVRQSFELGVLGLLVFAWMQVRILKKSYCLARRCPDPTLRGFAFGVYGATVAFLVHALAATTFSTIRTAEPFFFAVGVLYAIGLYFDGSSGLEEELPSELPGGTERGLPFHW